MAMKKQRSREQRGITIFRYQKGISFMHKANSCVKLCAFLALSFSLPFAASRAGGIFYAVIIVFLVFLSRVCGFSFASQLREARPFLFYFAFLYAAKTAPMVFLLRARSFSAGEVLGALFPGGDFCAAFFSTMILVQGSQLFYKTTTSTELKDALETVEKKISGKTRFSRVFTVYVSFVPQVFEAWNRLERAWWARGGKNGVSKAAVLVPALFSLCFSAAWQKARALAAREALADRDC
jgi:energy-coupling factor transporter transmembrane protein EcfT